MSCGRSLKTKLSNVPSHHPSAQIHPLRHTIPFMEQRMQDVRAKYVPPAVDDLAFNCPHCGTLAKQFWFSIHADPLKRDSTPLLLDTEQVKDFTLDHIKEPEELKRVKKWAERMAKGCGKGG